MPENTETTRITVAEVAERQGFKDTWEMLERIGLDSVVPACCNEDCQVEPDGRCEHGNPSILLALGVI